MKKVYFLLNLFCLGILIPGAFGQTTSFNFTTGVAQTYTVPAGASSIGIDMTGAQAGAGDYGNSGKGGRVQCTINATPGTTYTVYVGNIGINSGSNSGTWGYNGLYYGGNGVTSTYYTGGGGAGTEIWFGGSVLTVAGAGGSTGGDCTSDYGGPGGGITGGNGLLCNSYNASYCGGGGTQTAGGPLGSITGCGGTAGSRGTGGNGGNSCTNWAGAGGGGYYGGGGAVDYGGGGGGSSFPAAAGGQITAITHTQGYQTGAGYVRFTVLCAAPGAIVGTTSVCQGATTALTNPTGASGGTWISGNTAVGTISTTGVFTGISAGTSIVTYQLGSPCGGTNATATITVLPVPAPIGGTLSACIGGAASATDAVGGGTWVSGTTGVATINSATGAVTPVSVGTTILSYNLGNGCASVGATFTVNALPASITGPNTVCQGSNITLSETTSGGTWSSASSGVTVSGASVTGLTGGTATITYTMPTGPGCQVTYPVTVNADGPITGGTSVCISYSIPLSSSTPGGGTWTSSTPSVATIVSTTGVATSVAIGATTISFTSTTTGCVTTAPLNVTPPPSSFTMTGGGAYCAGSTTGVPIGMSGSGLGVAYTLFNGASIVGVITGTGSAVSFGTSPYASGTYTAVAAFGSACANTMLGTAVITINALPTAFTVTGGGAYCLGGTGIAVGLSSSTIGVNYQLYVSGTPIGTAIAGTGSAISFGLQTTTGTYTVVATNASTSCSSTMTGSVTVSTSPLPTAFSVTPSSGGVCAGGAGVVIGLSGSSIGTNYQLLLGGATVGGLVAGTGSSISFGSQTTAGTYTISAINSATSCTNTMSGSAIISANPLPTAYTVSGGGSYCFGGSGLSVSLLGSQAGVNYQLMLGSTPVGSPVAGTGTSITFGPQTSVGSYTVVATNTTTLCTNNMTGSVSIATTALPNLYGVTGGGSYCAGGSGVPVGLSGSDAGVNYQLFNGTTLLGGASGTGIAVTFGNQTLSGIYKVVALNATTGCTSSMSGSVSITINPLPPTFNVTGGGSYCAGGTGVVVGLTGSTSGVNYQLYNGSVPAGSVIAGTGLALSLGLQTGAGSYTVVGINATTGCTSNMAGSTLITINPLPTIYTLTGGGGYCTGTSGVVIGLSGSNSGISYQLYNTAGAVGAPVIGTGGAISFGLQTTASARDSVVATNPGTTCVSVMSGNVPVSINSLPVQFSMTGGGSYCSGGTGLMVNLGGSVTGVMYQLYNGAVASGAPIAGTGSPLTFGPLTASGTYTIIATTLATGCTNNMAGSASISINPLPAVFSVTGGGTYCAGTGGLHVLLSSSVSGTNYQLYNGGLPVGSLVPGTGLTLDLGAQTAAGTYTVVASIPGTLCQSNMSGSVTININPLPTVYTVTQTATSYCAGGAGVHIGLSSSSVGFSYQLISGGIPSGAPVSGTGSAIDFGVRTAAGSYTATATNTTTGCTANMAGTATLAVNALPPAQTMLPGGSYCPGGAGVILGLAGSNSGISYTLYNGPTSTGVSVPGTGLPISFGAQTAPGNYTVVATNTGSGCVNNMTGSATVSISPIPTVYNVTGGGNYCVGGTGVNVGLSNSATGVLYQLFAASAPMGAPVPGTGSAISFGLQTTTGTYTVVASSGTGCTNTMFGSAVVGTNPLPAAFNVTGGGSYCAGGTGIPVGLDGSSTGTVYSMFTGGLPAGGTVSGTGGAISFGMVTTGGTYTVIATNTATGCTRTMTGSATAAINPLPSGFTVGGGGSYCAGGAGVDITISGSDPAATYQLYNGTTMVGVALPGSGSVLDFGPQSATGTYSVRATNSGTGCMALMTGTVNVAINPLPMPFIVSGGGNYCAGGAGVHVMLSGSNPGVTYMINIGSIPTGTSLAGTGSALDFGPQYAAGDYTITATASGTSCKNDMIGSVTVVINPLPTVYTASGTSSSYCAGGSGVGISLSNSDMGINYQVFYGATAIGSVIAGTGSGISFGYVTGTGTYTIRATNTTTGCMDNMTPNINVVISPLPVVHTVTGGGNYCSGGTGVHVGLNTSNAGINYQLYAGGVATGPVVPGTGAALDFGPQTTAGAYTVVGTNNATGCSSNMTGSVTVGINALPILYSITGSGNYCAGGTGIELGLSGSSLGISYQLWNGGVATGSPMTGTGTAFSFGSITGAGTYTVKATSGAGCASTMLGSSVIVVNPLPVAYPLSGGGNFCPGGTGVPVGLANSSSGVTYQLFVGSTPVGTGVGGVSSTAISFGLQTTPGTYTVVASNNITGCNNNMTGYKTIGLNALPAAFIVTGGGNYCEGGAGVHIGLNNSAAGISYALIDSPTGITTVSGTGGPLDFGYQTTGGTYTVMGTNTTTGCSALMTGTAAVVVNPVVTPIVTVSNTVGDTVCSGSYTMFTALPVNGGAGPTFQWSVNGIVVGVGSGYNYIPLNGDVVSVTMVSNANCALPASANGSKNMTVLPKVTPTVTASVDPGNTVCLGTSVTYTASYTYGGTAPTFVWLKNGTAVSTASSFSYMPANNDNLYCVMTSNYACRLANSASTSHIAMTVAAPLTPVVTISVNPGVNVSAGDIVTLTANIVNAGASPVITWLINGAVVPGATGNTMTSVSFNNGDSVTCQVVSTGACNGLTGFNSVVLHMANVGVKPVSLAGSNLILIPNPNNGQFTIKGNVGTADEEVTLQVVNMLGQVIYNEKVMTHNGELDQKVQLSGNLANGMYLMNLQSAGENRVFHFVIEQ